MKRALKVILVLLFMAISMDGYCYYMDIFQLRDNFIPNSLGVVEIISQFKGTGVPILINNRPFILTNSHILGDRDNASIIIPEKTVFLFKYCFDSESKFYDKEFIEKKFQMKGPLPLSKKIVLADMSVDFNSPGADLAIFKIHEDVLPEVRNLIHAMGARNVQFFKATRRNPTGFFVTQNNGNGLANIIDGVQKMTSVLSPYLPVYIADRYISGMYRRIIILPVFAYPGLSGGAFYHHGELRGILTKVGLGTTPDGYLIPIEEISRIINEQYFNFRISKRKIKKSDNNFFGKIKEVSIEKKYYLKDSAKLEVFKSFDLKKKKQGKLGDCGGEIGNGGGEISNGGGSSYGEFWRLHINPLIGNKAKIVTTFNPFRLIDHDNESNRYIHLMNIDKNGTNIIWDSTMAKRNWLLGYKKMEWNFIDKKGLLEERKIKSQTHYPKYVRWYDRISENEFKSRIHNMNTNVGDRIQALFPEGNIRYNQSIYIKILDGNPEEVIDGYHQSYPIMARKSQENIFDVKSNPMAFDQKFSGIASNKHEDIRIVFNKDFERIDLEVNSRSLILEKTSTDETYKIIYKSTDGKFKGIVLFDSDDISKIDRIFVETPLYLYELVVCTPGETCMR